MAFRPRPYRSYAKVHEPQSPFPPSIFASSGFEDQYDTEN